MLVQLFRASRRFNVQIQPQLVLLQKTLLNVEGLGRDLDPELDLWSTAKPFLERWMDERMGWRALVHGVRNEAPAWAGTLPQLPRLMHQALVEPTLHHAVQREQLERLTAAQRFQGRLLAVVALLLAALVTIELYRGFT